jgi:hypothetical protein
MPINLQGIYINAAISSVIAFLLLGFAIRNLRLPANEQLLWLAFIIALPLQPLAFYLLRVPLDNWLHLQFGSNSAGFAWVKTLYAPLTEELAKLIPLVLPAIARDINGRNFVRYALAIGVGFAIGEMWFVAERIAREPSLSQLPFYQFGGYLGERLMTCVFHSAFVAIGLWQLHRRLIVGFAGAVLLHWLTNFPVFLMAWNIGGIGTEAWLAIIFCALILEFFAALALLTYFAFGRVALPKLFYGPRQCPECAAEYDAPLLALNFFHVRYERCPHCVRWHWTKPAPKCEKATDDVPNGPAG